MGELVLHHVQSPLDAFYGRVKGRDEDYGPIDKIVLGDWINIDVRIELKLQAEITAPFMEAFLETQKSFYQLAALIKYGGADIRSLSDQDLELFQIRVKVADG